MLIVRELLGGPNYHKRRVCEPNGNRGRGGWEGLPPWSPQDLVVTNPRQVPIQMKFQQAFMITETHYEVGCRRGLIINKTGAKHGLQQTFPQNFTGTNSRVLIGV